MDRKGKKKKKMLYNFAEMPFIKSFMVNITVLVNISKKTGDNKVIDS